MSGSPYTHGASEPEQQRLTALNTRLNNRCIEVGRFEVGERIIDFGAGLGQFSRAMARITGVPVAGLERSQEQIAEALRQAEADGETSLLQMRQGDIVSPPLSENESGQFDVAHARFVLEHMPDPLLVVRNMARTVRVGGRVVLADGDYETLRLWPEPAGFAQLWQAYQRTYDRHGNVVLQLTGVFLTLCDGGVCGGRNARRHTGRGEFP
jgi:2-polyprenyl-3-methyl-5-hydroxy-6-metoxy-1,4-benzoquinol methylase